MIQPNDIVIGNVSNKNMFNSQDAKRLNKVPIELVELSRLAAKPYFT